MFLLGRNFDPSGSNCTPRGDRAPCCGLLQVRDDVSPQMDAPKARFKTRPESVIGKGELRFHRTPPLMRPIPSLPDTAGHPRKGI